MNTGHTESTIIPALLSETETAIYLGVSRGFLRESRCYGPRKNRADAPAYVRFGKAVRYRRCDLDKWIEAHLVVPVNLAEA